MRLRPYHPTYVVSYFGQEQPPGGSNGQGFRDVMEKIQSDPDIEVELVEEYDDICEKCTRRVEDEKGSVWGERHSCPSSNNPDTVTSVNATNARVLRDLGLEFGSVVKWGDLVKLLRERIPVLDDNMLGGAKRQEDYDKGLAALLNG